MVIEILQLSNLMRSRVITRASEVINNYKVISNLAKNRKYLLDIIRRSI